MKPKAGWSYGGTHTLAAPELQDAVAKVVEGLGGLHPQLRLDALGPWRERLARGGVAHFRSGTQEACRAELLVSPRTWERSGGILPMVRYSPGVFDKAFFQQGLLSLHVHFDGASYIEAARLLSCHFPKDEPREQPGRTSEMPARQQASLRLARSLLGREVSQILVQRYTIDGLVQEDGEGPPELVLDNGRSVHLGCFGQPMLWEEGPHETWSRTDPGGREHRVERAPLDPALSGVLRSLKVEHWRSKFAYPGNARGWELGFDEGTLRVRPHPGPRRTIALQRDGLPYVKRHAAYTVWMAPEDALAQHNEYIERWNRRADLT